jgi:hypothetical protein
MSAFLDFLRRIPGLWTGVEILIDVPSHVAISIVGAVQLGVYAVGTSIIAIALQYRKLGSQLDP